MILKIILTLLVSACIGYTTNYIAVKMLFRPLKPIYIKGKKLPFTPGIIPKGQPRLAKALGEAVSSTLLTNDDLQKALNSEKTKKIISDEICRSIYSSESSSQSIKNILIDFSDSEKYEKIRTIIKEKLCIKISQGLKNADIAGIIAVEGGNVLKEKFSGGMLAMFINDELINSVAEPIGEKIEEYIDGNGQLKIQQMTEEQISVFEQKSLTEILEDNGISHDIISHFIEQLYEKVIADKILTLIKTIDINKMVENKVNSMNVMELEKLVMSVMKNELNAVINIGALIGLVIGILNVIIGVL